MPFTVEFTLRDFSAPFLPFLHPNVERLSWSAFGGPDEADLTVTGDRELLFQLFTLLRCGVLVRDAHGEPAWWGFVSEILIHQAQIEIGVSIDDLTNRVKVIYTCHTGKIYITEEEETDWLADALSQAEFGIREKVLRFEDLDHKEAEAHRHTYLTQNAFPRAILSAVKRNGAFQVSLRCVGWFKTLSWQTYTNPLGFQALYSGPGSFIFADSAARLRVGQRLYVASTWALKYAYFKVRRSGSPTRYLYAQVYSDVSGSPGSILATSQAFDTAPYAATGYAWYRFEFSPSVTLTAPSPTYFWVVLEPVSADPSSFWEVRIDENCGGIGVGKYLDSTGPTWKTLPSLYNYYPDLYHRFIGVQDTGAQLGEIAAACGQFFTRIKTLSSGVETAMFRNRYYTGWEEVHKLMRAGTSAGRLILASVDPQRRVEFYAQPDPAAPDVYMDAQNRFFTLEGVPLKPHQPPIGRYARYAGSTRITLPFDRRHVPACFVARASFFPSSGKIQINTPPNHGF